VPAVEGVHLQAARDSDADLDPVVEIYQGYRSSYERPNTPRSPRRKEVERFAATDSGAVARFEWTDRDPPGGGAWYFLRVRQQDGQLAWSSPIWFHKETRK
jgi:hypothetical protein